MTAPAELVSPLVSPLVTPHPGDLAGFVLYVGLRDDPAGGAHTGPGDLAEVAEALRDLARDLLPTAETFTALSLVPRPAAPDDVRTLRARLAHLRPLDEGAAAAVAPAAAGRPLAVVPDPRPHTPDDAWDDWDDDGADGAPTGPPDPTRLGTRIDLSGRRVAVAGQQVRLTRLEFALLAHLVRAPHRVVGRAELLQTVWGGTFRPGTRTVDVHVRRLRAKVTGSAIATVRGIGYRFDPTPRIVLSGSVSAT